MAFLNFDKYPPLPLTQSVWPEVAIYYHNCDKSPLLATLTQSGLFLSVMVMENIHQKTQKSHVFLNSNLKKLLKKVLGYFYHKRR